MNYDAVFCMMLYALLSMHENIVNTWLDVDTLSRRWCNFENWNQWLSIYSAY